MKYKPNLASDNSSISLWIYVQTATHSHKRRGRNQPLYRNYFQRKRQYKIGEHIVLPALALAPETGLEFGVVTQLYFFIDKSDSLIRSSHVGLIATVTSKKQSNVKLFTNLWSSNNTYHYIAELGYRDYPFNFYGIGDQTLARDKMSLIQNLFQNQS